MRFCNALYACAYALNLQQSADNLQIICRLLHFFCRFSAARCFRAERCLRVTLQLRGLHNRGGYSTEGGRRAGCEAAGGHLASRGGGGRRPRPCVQYRCGVKARIGKCGDKQTGVRDDKCARVGCDRGEVGCDKARWAATGRGGLRGMRGGGVGLPSAPGGSIGHRCPASRWFRLAVPRNSDQVGRMGA